MCGITGIWRYDGKPINPQELIRFNDALLHRGPDSGDIFIDNKHNLGLGHRRLAIHDLSSNGAQPMTFRDRYVISFNGEIYNYRELRHELKLLGYQFYSNSDTEVALYAFAQWGVSCFERFNGMWAMALWDSFEGKLRICIDRYAVKSCLYYKDSNQFAFASELKAFAQLPDVDLTQDLPYIQRKLFNQNKSNEDTLLAHAKRIPAGHYLEIDSLGDYKLTRWWHTLKHLPQPPRSYNEQVEQFSSLLTDSIKLRLSTDTKYGIPISGGMDSSSVMLTAKSILSDKHEPIHGFVISKHGALDETLLAREICQTANASLTEVTSNKQLSVDMLERLTWTYEDTDRASEGPYRLYQSMRQQSRVVSLDGHGGDELMAGYHFYLPAAFSDAFAGMPNLAKIFDLSLLGRDIGFIRENMKPWQGWHTSKKLLNDAIKDRFSKKQGPIYANNDLEDYPEHFDCLNRALYHDVHYGFLQNILRTFDYASMAHGVEARTPFLDWRLVTYLFSLPSDSKLKHGFTKRILRQAMANKLPDSVRLKKAKIGFVDSNHYHFNANTIAWAKDKLNSANNLDYLDHRKIIEKFDAVKGFSIKDLPNLHLMFKIAKLIHLTEEFSAKKEENLILRNRTPEIKQSFGFEKKQQEAIS